MQTHFPDSRIGASLKRRGNCRRRRGRAYFPDSRIGASLKPDPLREGKIDVQHFPDSRIGASLKRMRSVSIRCRSPALPRFANRGLIEASAIQNSSASPVDTSPIRESGPH